MRGGDCCPGWGPRAREVVPREPGTGVVPEAGQPRGPHQGAAAPNSGELGGNPAGASVDRGARWEGWSLEVGPRDRGAQYRWVGAGKVRVWEPQRWEQDRLECGSLGLWAEGRLELESGCLSLRSLDILDPEYHGF